MYNPSTNGKTIFDFYSTNQRLERAKQISRQFPGFEYLKKTGYQHLSWADKLKYEQGISLEQLMDQSRFFQGQTNQQNERISIDDENEPVDEDQEMDNIDDDAPDNDDFNDSKMQEVNVSAAAQQPTQPDSPTNTSSMFFIYLNNNNNDTLITALIVICKYIVRNSRVRLQSTLPNLSIMPEDPSQIQDEDL